MAQIHQKENSKTQTASWHSVGGERNGHGTRICKRINCSACGKLDYISFNAQHLGTTLCRLCARDKLKVFEDGEREPVELEKINCERCKKVFTRPTFRDQWVQCPDCVKGFDVWKGALDDKDKPKREIVTRKGGLLLRKRLEVKA